MTLYINTCSRNNIFKSNTTRVISQIKRGTLKSGTVFDTDLFWKVSTKVVRRRHFQTHLYSDKYLPSALGLASSSFSELVHPMSRIMHDPLANPTVEAGSM